VVHSANTEKKEGRVTAASVVAEEKSITNEEGRRKVFQKKFSQCCLDLQMHTLLC
jgi:hypothetical protein